MSGVLVLALYRFQEIPEGLLASARDDLFELGERSGIRGLLLLAQEGVNGTVCGEPAQVRTFIEAVQNRLAHGTYSIKESCSNGWPFKRLQVQVRPEIVTLDGSVFRPGPVDERSRLSPNQWHEWLSPKDGSAAREYTLVDVRNWYETKLGKFKGAIDPDLKNFGEFPKFLAESGIPRDRPLLMYCTGGIRCEKAAPLLRSEGYSEVYQLEGGILNYLAAYPNSNFEGECYVFDHRVAVDQNLAPSQQYGLCPHCGNPAASRISCGNCAKDCSICEDCAALVARNSCSKNCAHHISLRSNFSTGSSPSSGAVVAKSGVSSGGATNA